MNLPLILGGALAILISFGVVGWKAFTMGETSKAAECLADAADDTNDKVDIRKEQDEIRNRPRSDKLTIVKLRSHRF